MNQNDECELLTEGFNTKYELFYSNYNEYISYDNSSDLVKSKEKILDLIISDLEKFMRNKIGFCKDHSKLIKHVEFLYSNFSNFVQKYKTLRDQRNKIQKNTKNSIKKKEEKNIVQIKENDINFNDNYEIQPSQEYKEQEGDMIYLDKSEALLLLECLENEKEYSETENLIKIQEIVQKISYFTEKFNRSVNQTSHMIQEIDRNVSQSIENVDRSKEELRQAALYQNKKDKLKFSIYGGIAGFVAPGIGNLIGISVGYLIAKLQEKGIKNIEPHKYQK